MEMRAVNPKTLASRRNSVISGTVARKRCCSHRQKNDASVQDAAARANPSVSNWRTIPERPEGFQVLDPQVETVAGQRRGRDQNLGAGPIRLQAAEGGVAHLDQRRRPRAGLPQHRLPRCVKRVVSRGLPGVFLRALLEQFRVAQ